MITNSIEQSLNLLLQRVKSLFPIFLFSLLIPTTLWAQNQRFGVLQGVVIDRTTRLPIENVNVFFQGLPKGTITDSTGRFALHVPLGRSVQVVFSHISYDKLTKNYRFNRPDTLFLDTSLKPRVIESEEVTVTATKLLKERIAIYTISGIEIQECGEEDMEHKLRYFIPNVVKPYEVRMMHPSQDFTLYVDGKWIESDWLNDVDPATVKRVFVWGGLKLFPIGFPLIRGSFVVGIETK